MIARPTNRKEGGDEEERGRRRRGEEEIERLDTRTYCDNSGE